MGWLTNLIKSHVIPGSVPLLIVSIGLGLALLRVPGKTIARVARVWLASVTLAYWFISTPFGADLLVAGVQGDAGAFEGGHDRAGINAVVLLTGGVATYHGEAGALETLTSWSAFRALETARVWRLLGPDAWVIVSGGIVDEQRDLRPHSETIRDALVQLQVPRERILVEGASANTRQHAVYLPDLLRSHGIDRFVLVTSPTHIRRAMLAFRALGMNPIPSTARLHSKGTTDWRWTRWWPDGDALRISQAALYDCFALIYYTSRGWLTASS